MVQSRNPQIDNGGVGAAALKRNNSQWDPSDREKMIAAMIENARRSDWKTNLQNAVAAHESFMLPHRKNERGDELLRQIQRRRVEMMSTERNSRGDEEGVVGDCDDCGNDNGVDWRR